MDASRAGAPSPRRFRSAARERIVPNDAATHRRSLAALGSKSLTPYLCGTAVPAACAGEKPLHKSFFDGYSTPLNLFLRHGLLGSRLPAKRELGSRREVLHVVL